MLIEGLIAIHGEIDTDGDGTIDKEEVLACIRKGTHNDEMADSL